MKTLIARVVRRGMRHVTSWRNRKNQDYRSVLILGNSIVRHPPKADIGWPHNWGMAASALELDFVHLLTERFQARRHDCQVMSENIATWEVNPATPDLQQMALLRAMNPTLVMIRFGENITDATASNPTFATHFAALLAFFAKPQTRVVVFGPYWERPVVDAAMRRVCQEAGVQYVPLMWLSYAPGNSAIGLFEHPGVAMHPSDQGMQAIADEIWSNI